MAWCSDLEEGDSIKIGGMVIRLGKKQGRRARLEVDAPDDVVIEHVKKDKKNVEIIKKSISEQKKHSYVQNLEAKH